MKTSESGKSFIRSFESLKLNAYVCPAGLKTIGYGHVLKDNENWSEISIENAEEIFENDLKIAEDAVKRNIFIDLEEFQFDALTSFTFNLGSGALQRSSLRQKINRYEIEDANAEFCKWIYAKGVKLRGLVNRRFMESLMFQGAF